MTKAESVACYRHKHCGGDIRIKTKHYFFFNLRYRRKMTVFVRLLRFMHYHSILQFISVGAQITATHYDVVQYHPYDIIHN